MFRHSSNASGERHRLRSCSGLAWSRPANRQFTGQPRSSKIFAAVQPPSTDSTTPATKLASSERLKGGDVQKIVAGLLAAGSRPRSRPAPTPRSGAGRRMAPSRSSRRRRASLQSASSPSLSRREVRRRGRAAGRLSPPAASGTLLQPHRRVTGRCSRRHQAGAADRDAARAGWRHAVRDRRRHDLAAAHNPGRDRRALRKRLGLAVTSDKVDGRGRVYRTCGSL